MVAGWPARTKLRAVTFERAFMPNIVLYYSDSTGNCPDANFTCTGQPQYSGAGIAGCAGREHIVEEHNPLTIQPAVVANRKRMAHISEALQARKQSLSTRR